MQLVERGMEESFGVFGAGGAAPGEQDRPPARMACGLESVGVGGNLGSGPDDGVVQGRYLS
ncbi:MAG: hypothetical protein AAF772_15045 [Acidobacteriota bacterium]